MPGTYDSIATTTLGSNTNTVTFSSISANYTDLIIVIGGRLVTGGTTCRMQFNNDTTTNYSQTNVAGNGTSVGSSSNSNQTYFRIGEIYAGLSTSQSTTIIQVNNYANTTTYKTAMIRLSDPSGEVATYMGQWRKTPEAINRIDLIAGASDNWVSGSTFTLYGIKAA